MYKAFKELYKAVQGPLRSYNATYGPLKAFTRLHWALKRAYTAISALESDRYGHIGPFKKLCKAISVHEIAVSG